MFGDDIREALPELQEEAASLFTLGLQAYAPGLGPDDNGITVPKPMPQGDPICGKINGSSESARDARTRMVTIGAVTTPVLEAGLHLPICAYIVDGVLQIVASEDPAAAWRFQVVSLGLRDDQSLIGRWFQVVGVPAKSYATARRLDIAEV